MSFKLEENLINTRINNVVFRQEFYKNPDTKVDGPSDLRGVDICVVY